MTVPPTDRPATPSEPGAARPGRRRDHRWWPLAALWAAIGVVGAISALQAWQADRLADARTVDTSIVAEAARSEAMAQRLGRLAALAVAPVEGRPAALDAIADELAQSRQGALELWRLERGIEQVSADGALAVNRRLEQWEAVRERLWYRAESLLSQGASAREGAFAEAASAVQREADAAAAAARGLVDAMQAHSRELGDRAAEQARHGAMITVAVLGLLALAVVLPTLRALRAQARRLEQQASAYERLALVAEYTGNLVVITDRERRVVWVNPAFTRATGFELHEVQGQVPGSLLQSSRTDAAEVQRMRRALDAGEPVRAELLNRSRDGREYWIDADIQPLRDAAGALTGYIAVESVITEQVTARLRSAALLTMLPTAVVVHGRDGRVTQVNLAASEMLGAAVGDSADALLQRLPLDEDLEPLDGPELPVVRTLRTGRGERACVLAIEDGQGARRWLLAHTQPLTDALGAPDGAVACYVDMTERRRLLEQMRDAARRDPLTSMPNRAVVLERVQRAIDHRQRNPGYGFAVLFMDVDRFKQVNDTMGHDAGDDLLRQVAARLEHTLRPGDAVGRLGSELRTAARIGGDEFVIVLEGIRSADDACLIAQRLLQELAQPYRIGADAVHVSVSIGIVWADQAAADAGDVLRDCDTAMYEAKRAGRGRWVMFDASMHERVRSALEMEGELRQALVAHQLYVVYQPVVRLDGRSLAGVEALVRWRHPDRGEIMPGQFIGLAEECGLIDDIGEVVLRQACEQFALWQERWGSRAPALLAVNLSRAQLRQPGLAAEVGAVLAAAGMRPDQLQLEVTESFAAQDVQVQSMLRSLKALGVRLALDDFGTGYSSLACLHQLPVDTVKIDRSFVAHAREVEYHRVLISATIRVARTLGMTTVAEGIETDDQAELMAAMACDRGQGWLFGRPMKADELNLWIEREASDTLA